MSDITVSAAVNTFMQSADQTAMQTAMGTTPVNKGGTGQTTASAAINALLPSQSGQSGKVLGSNGTAASWVSAGGGSAISDPEVAYIRSDGNDLTGAVGNPALPYLTGQAAYLDGAKYFDIGADVDAGSVTVTVADEVVWVRGRGLTESKIYFVAVGGRNITIYDSAGISCSIGAQTMGLSDTVPAGNITAFGGFVSFIAGANAANTAGAGQNSGNITVFGPAYFNYLYAEGQNGMEINDPDNPSPDGGDGGLVTLIGPVLQLQHEPYVSAPLISCVKGSGGINTQNGVGADGTDGNVNARSGADIPTPSVGVSTPTYIGVTVNNVFTAS